ncbi:hypothetical protein Busp01_03580 [Trinickia caryophylli]|nr:hypothetical protein Busp01_03580 [Trinickia caryophylli]
MIRIFVEADMRVADLHEAEAGIGARRVVTDGVGLRHTALHQPEGSGARQCHAFEKAASARGWDAFVATIHDGLFCRMRRHEKRAALREGGVRAVLIEQYRRAGVFIPEECDAWRFVQA